MFRTASINALFLLSLMGIVFWSGCKGEEKTVDGGDTPAGETPTNLRGNFQKAPAFSLLDVDGKQVSLNAFEGKVTLINFWATWCLPCRREMPGLRDAPVPEDGHLREPQVRPRRHPGGLRIRRPHGPDKDLYG